jgi:DNA-3-methyladenine glycosylase I
LSWNTIYAKRDAFSTAFRQFDYNVISQWEVDDKHYNALMNNSGIIRNKRKISSVLNNAKIAAQMDKDKENGFVKYIWSFAKQQLESERLLCSKKMLTNHMRDANRINEDPSTVTEADGVHPTRIASIIQKQMKADGFQHLGVVTILCFMQAVGMCNHHDPSCCVYEECEKQYRDALMKLKLK